MAWMAAADRIGSCRESTLAAQCLAGRDAVLRKGTLYIEAEAPTLASGAVLARWRRAAPVDGLVSVQWVPAQGVLVLVTQGDDVWHMRVPLADTPERLSILMSWDPADGCRLVVDQPDGPVFAVSTSRTCPPLRVSDLWTVSSTTLAGSGTGIAFGDAEAPIGPWPTFSVDTPVETPRGPVAMGHLRPGDTVRTWTGDIVPVLHVIRQDVPAIGRFRPVTLRAAAMGCARDVTVAGSQRMVIGGVEVRETFGCNAVRMTVSDLPAPALLPHGSDVPSLTYAQLVLPEGDSFISQGLVFESLSFAALKRDWKRFALGPLAGCPWHQLPAHPPPPYPVLRPADVARLTEGRRARA